MFVGCNDQSLQTEAPEDQRSSFLINSVDTLNSTSTARHSFLEAYESQSGKSAQSDDIAVVELNGTDNTNSLTYAKIDTNGDELFDFRGRGLVLVEKYIFYDSNRISPVEVTFSESDTSEYLSYMSVQVEGTRTVYGVEENETVALYSEQNGQIISKDDEEEDDGCVGGPDCTFGECYKTATDACSGDGDCRFLCDSLGNACTAAIASACAYQTIDIF